MSQSLGWAGTLVFVSILAPVARAQTTGQPAAAGAPSQAVNNPARSQSNSGPPLQPDTHPLGGAYLFTLGSLEEGHNYLQPAISIGEMATTNAGYLSNVKQEITTATVPEGSLTLVSQSRRNDFSLGYLGGGFIYNNEPGLSGTFQSASVSDQIQFRRLILGFSDSFSYLPQSAFGFGGFGGLGGGLGLTLGSGLSGINPSFMPGQSILTNETGAINNTSLVQAQYFLSARTSVTAVGSYGLFQARQSHTGFLSGNMIAGSGAIQHALTARDDIGFSYQFGTFRYSGLADGFKSNSVDVNYGRKITGRLALQISGGPEFIQNHIGSFHSSQVIASGFGDLTYVRGRNTFALSGGRYASSGSGVLAGADTEVGSGSWSRRLTQRVSASFAVGIARNTALLGPSALNSLNSLNSLNGASVAPARAHYEYWYTGGDLNWALTRYVSIYATYNYQRQVTNAGACTVSACAGNLARQVFGVGFIFTPRPIGL